MSRPVAIDIWISEPAKKQLEKILKPDMEGLEFGSGCSTIWLAQRVKSLVSVEHDKKWYERVKKLLEQNNIENVKLVYAEVKDYLKVLKNYRNETLDFVFSDGLKQFRSRCIRASWPKIKKGGIMIIDNSETIHPRKGIKFIEKQGAKGKRYRGPVTNPWTGRRNEKGVETSIWIK